MTRAIFLLAALLPLTGGCATMEAERMQNDAAAPPPPPPPQAQSAPGPIGGTVTSCMLTIQFGSYAMGIDGATRTRVESLLVADRTVTGFDSRRWGHEGEMTFCVRTRGAADARRLFRTIRPMIPARSNGPIELRTSDGLRYATQPPR